MNNCIIQSYVYSEGKCFFVSTINRQSSAALAHGSTYAETMAWDFDPATKKRGRQVGQDESAQDSIAAHLRACERLHATGSMDNEQDAE